MEKLKEQRTFRNQLIIVSMFLLISGIAFNIAEGIAFGIIFGLLAIWNIITYKQNKKDWEILNGKD